LYLSEKFSFAALNLSDRRVKSILRELKAAA
jgi:hypothetical protein